MFDFLFVVATRKCHRKFLLTDSKFSILLSLLTHVLKYYEIYEILYSALIFNVMGCSHLLIGHEKTLAGKNCS